MTTFKTNTTSISTLSLNKLYNFKIVHKYNIMGGLSQKCKPTQSGNARVTKCQFFVCLIFLALLTYSSSMLLLMTTKMFKIILKSLQLTIICCCNSGIWMSLILASSFLALALVPSPRPWLCPRFQVLVLVLGS